MHNNVVNKFLSLCQESVAVVTCLAFVVTSFAATGCSQTGVQGSASKTSSSVADTVAHDGLLVPSVMRVASQRFGIDVSNTMIIGLLPTRENSAVQLPCTEANGTGTQTTYVKDSSGVRSFVADCFNPAQNSARYGLDTNALARNSHTIYLSKGLRATGTSTGVTPEQIFNRTSAVTLYSNPLQTLNFWARIARDGSVSFGGLGHQVITAANAETILNVSYLVPGNFSSYPQLQLAMTSAGQGLKATPPNNTDFIGYNILRSDASPGGTGEPTFEDMVKQCRELGIKSFTWKGETFEVGDPPPDPNNGNKFHGISKGFIKWLAGSAAVVVLVVSVAYGLIGQPIDNQTRQHNILLTTTAQAALDAAKLCEDTQKNYLNLLGANGGDTEQASILFNSMKDCPIPTSTPSPTPSPTANVVVTPSMTPTPVTLPTSMPGDG